MLPITRADWEEDHLLMGEQHKLTEEQAVKESARWLIERLYVPDSETGCHLGKLPPGLAPMGEEPINWGDLGAFVVREGEVFNVTLEEAFTDICPMLCQYVGDWLQKWGWNVVVRTEW